MAQQPGTTTTTTTTIPSPTTTAPLLPTPPLTPQEQEEQNRLQNVIAATNQNLDEAEKEVNGIVYTPRWSDVVWVEPDSLAVLFAYCLPGEFAESGQEILGGFELEVLESYEIALAQGFMAWMMVIGNEDRQDRLPAAVGVICASDTNDVETRVLSPQEQQQINNVVQQFITTTQVTTIEQVINIINNVTTNGTGGTTTPPPPPPPPMGNDTGNGTGGTVGPRPPGGGAGGIPENATAEADTTPPVLLVPSLLPIETNFGQDAQVSYVVNACDNVDGAAQLAYVNDLHQDSQSNIEANCGLPLQDAIGGDITLSCNPPPGSYFVVGVTTVQCTAVDEAGNTGTASFTVRVNRPPIESPFLAQEQPPVEEEEQPPATPEEQPPSPEPQPEPEPTPEPEPSPQEGEQGQEVAD
jgi:hypothetical protein